MSILITIIIIAVLILFHEWGHFITARKIGIPVYEFSIGFGYKLFSKRVNGVEYSLRLFPIGGFVRMAGAEPDDLDDPNGFSKRTPLEKIAVAFAGPFMNFVLALFIFIYAYSVIGIPMSLNEPIIGKVMEGKPAITTGLKDNDKVLAVNNQEVKTWSEFTAVLADNPEGKAMDIKIEREGEIANYSVLPEQNPNTGNYEIGVLSKIAFERQGILTSVKIGLQQTYELTVLLLSGLGLLITGGASTADLAGPVGITQLVGEAAQVGTVFLLTFAAFLSINLGVLNLLPIPALDGSRIVLAIVEAIRRKPLEPEKEGFIHFIGFMFLILLIIIVTYNDIVRLIKG